MRRIMLDSIDDLTWSELGSHLLDFVKTVRQLIQDEASKELESGHRDSSGA